MSVLTLLKETTTQLFNSSIRRCTKKKAELRTCPLNEHLRVAENREKQEKFQIARSEGLRRNTRIIQEDGNGISWHPV